MLQDLLLKILPPVIIGIGTLCLKYPNRMRRIILYVGSILVAIGMLIIIYAAGYLKFYVSTVKELDTTKLGKRNPCDTSLITKMESDYNDGITDAKVIIMSNEQISASNFQYYGNFYLIVIYSLGGFLIATYLSEYVSKKMPKKSNNEVKDNAT